MDRRTFTLTLLSSVALAGCSSIGRIGGPGQFRSDYRAVVDGDFKLPKIPIHKMDKKYLRQIVEYKTRERPGTIIVDVSNRFLYLVQPEGKAVRYGVGVGKQGFAWSGHARIGWKKE